MGAWTRRARAAFASLGFLGVCYITACATGPVERDEPVGEAEEALGGLNQLCNSTSPVCDGLLTACWVSGPLPHCNCRNLQGDVNNCGACGHACPDNHNSPLCVGGACYLGLCDAGFANCNGNWSDGCETSITTTTNCGACGVACTNGDCSTGTCTCSPGLTLCSHACVDLQKDNDNCGACGNSCGDTGTCQNGVCKCGNTGVACQEASMHCCNGECKWLSDPNNCGTCGNVCQLYHCCLTSGTYGCTTLSC